MKPTIGITMGDPAGIGGEITVRAFGHREIFEWCNPVVIGDYEVLRQANVGCQTGLTLRKIKSPQDALPRIGELPLMQVTHFAKGDWAYGQVSARCGDAAFQYVKRSVELAMSNRLDAIVTGPINKEALHLAGHFYSGHTEILADITKTDDYAMILSSGNLRVIHVSTHVSMVEACKSAKKEKIERVIRLADQAMRTLGIEEPRIAVAGLNAHASENGLFGDEETREIIPAIEAARASGICVHGPFPSDTVFVKALAGYHDIVVAMYHDQGHIPLKLCGFQLDGKTNQFTAMRGVNYTVGLPVIRTSVDHGTAFDRAGKYCSNEQSLIEAIDAAAHMASHKVESSC